MKCTTNQQGFSVVVAVLIVAVLAGLSFGGWYVWDKSQNSDTGSADKASSRNGKDDERTGSIEDTKYLVIKEWGVEIPLEEDISEAYYEFSSDELADYVALYDASFDRLKNADGISCGGDNTYQLYAISRAKPGNVAALNESAGPTYKEFPFTNEYVFGGLGPHQAPPSCAGLGPDPYGEEQLDENILKTADDKERLFDKAFGGLRSSEND